MSGEEPRARTLSAMVGISLVVLFFVVAGMVNTLLRHQDRAREAREQAELAVARQVQIWDRQVIEWSEEALATLDTPGALAELAERERRRREREPSFDAWYLWRPAASAGSPGAEGPTLLHPQAPLAEDLPTLNRTPCVVAAAEAEGEAAVEALLDCAADPNPAVRLFVVVGAGHLLLQAGEPERALAVLRALPVPRGLSEAAHAGFPQGRALLRALLIVDALAALDRLDEARALLVEVGEDLSAASGPVLEESLGTLRWTLIPRLEELGAAAEARSLEARLPRAERRLAAWREVSGRLGLARLDEGLRFVHDPYAAQPFLLAYRALSGGALCGAVQIEQGLLLKDLLGGQPGDLVITDAAGQRLAGAAAAPLFTTPFPRGLTHLRAGVTAARLEEARRGNTAQTLREGFGFAAMSLLGIWAILALKTASDKEQALLERQREFVTRVTHELKTPLAGIKVMAESLQVTGTRDPALITAFSDRIIAEADRLALRIDEILAVARASRPAEPAPYDLSALLGELIEEWEPRMAVAGVDLDAQIASVPALRGDMALMRDALVCLLDNALKYRDDRRDDARVEVSLGVRGREVVVEVADNGIGVPPAKRSIIFERFARVEEPGRGKAGGHGLGLAFVREAVDSQRGRVECQEGIDGGARFVVRLPLPG